MSVLVLSTRVKRNERERKNEKQSERQRWMNGEWDERFINNKGVIRWNYNRHSLNVHVRLHYYSLLLENWQKKSLTIDYKSQKPTTNHASSFYVPRNCYWIISLHKWRLYTLAHNSKSNVHVIEKTMENFDIENFHFYSESHYRRRYEHLKKFLFAVITFSRCMKPLSRFSFVYFSVRFSNTFCVKKIFF